MGNLAKKAAAAVSNALGHSTEARLDDAIAKLAGLRNEQNRLAALVDELELQKHTAIDDSASFGELAAKQARTRTELERVALLITRAEVNVETAKGAVYRSEFERAKQAAAGSYSRLADAAASLLAAEAALSAARAKFVAAWDDASSHSVSVRVAADKAEQTVGRSPVDIVTTTSMRETVEILEDADAVRRRIYNRNPAGFGGVEYVRIPSVETLAKDLRLCAEAAVEFGAKRAAE